VRGVARAVSAAKEVVSMVRRVDCSSSEVVAERAVCDWVGVPMGMNAVAGAAARRRKREDFIMVDWRRSRWEQVLAGSARESEIEWNIG